MERRELEDARDLGAATYLASYVRLMADSLGVPIADGQEGREQVALMVGQMVEPMNVAAGVAWALVMEDRAFGEKRLEELRALLEAGTS
jgi:hypothetical protein